jgi:hypothetical protein
MSDPINPNHYKQGGLESIDAIKAFMSEEAFKGFLKGNCQKYLFRYEQKNGIEDLKKCQWYLERLISILEEEQPSPFLAKFQEFMPMELTDPDAYMASGCPDGFCPMPNVRQGPAIMFDPAD